MSGCRGLSIPMKPANKGFTRGGFLRLALLVFSWPASAPPAQFDVQTF